MSRWNLDITKCQGTDKICLLHRGTFSYYFPVTGVNKIARYTVI